MFPHFNGKECGGRSHSRIVVNVSDSKDPFKAVLVPETTVKDGIKFGWYSIKNGGNALVFTDIYSADLNDGSYQTPLERVKSYELESDTIHKIIKQVLD
ncbi:CYP76M5 [Acrasis kona]|uniref:CYP76M5 n=1 Tax=Acrasis kona TaxID=1008807 RepID=A0AAW2Z5L8_9EUKA